VYRNAAAEFATPTHNFLPHQSLSLTGGLFLLLRTFKSEA